MWQFDKEKADERIAALGGGIARIKVSEGQGFRGVDPIYLMQHHCDLRNRCCRVLVFKLVGT